MYLNDFGNAAVGQPRWLNAIALSDRPKHCAFGDSGSFKPRLQGCHREGDHAARNGNDVAVPFLVCLAAADGDAKPFGRFLKVLDIERDELGATEGAGKADK